MNREQKDPVLESMRNNPWYTSDQIEAARGNQRRTVQRRQGFILRSIEGYLRSQPAKPIRVLDAGCGDGAQLELLTQIPGVEVWGADYSPLRVSRAQKNFPMAHIVCCNLLRLPYRSTSFDIIVCSQVIEHIPQDGLLLAELANSLKPQGLLILGTPNEGCSMARLRNYFLERSVSKTTDHVHFFTEPVIRRKIESAGFVVQQVMRENWFFPHQAINYYLSTRDWGFRLMASLSATIPSQTAGYYFVCVKSA